jgi:hypothetical protein
MPCASGGALLFSATPRSQIPGLIDTGGTAGSPRDRLTRRTRHFQDGQLTTSNNRYRLVMSVDMAIGWDALSDVEGAVAR